MSYDRSKSVLATIQPYLHAHNPSEASRNSGKASIFDRLLCFDASNGSYLRYPLKGDFQDCRLDFFP